MHSRALKVLRTLHSSIFRDAGMISSSVGLNGTPDLPADRANKQTNNLSCSSNMSHYISGAAVCKCYRLAVTQLC